MEWAIGIFLIVMIGLYVWSHVTAGHQIGKKLQPFVDEFFGVTPPAKRENKADSSSESKADNDLE